MNIENTRVNNYKQKTSFEGLKIKTKNPAVLYSETMKDHSFVNFILRNSCGLHFEDLSVYIKNQQQKKWDIFLNSKELKQLSEVVNEINEKMEEVGKTLNRIKGNLLERGIKDSTKEVSEYLNSATNPLKMAKEKSKELINKIVTDAIKSKKKHLPLSNKRIDSLIAFEEKMLAKYA